MFRFSIRDLLWLTLVAAVAAGWLIDRRLVISRLDQFDRRIAPFEEEFHAIVEQRKLIGKNLEELYGTVEERRKGLVLQPPEAEIPDSPTEARPASSR